MLTNRKTCRQVDLTDIDLDIMLKLSTPIESRKDDRMDSAIMLARTSAHGRGANPVEIQLNVNAYFEY